MINTVLATVIIYTLAGCPFCAKAKKLLDEKNIHYQEIEVDYEDIVKRKEVAALAEGRTTFPQIFINDKSIGGCDDLYKLDSEGRVDQLLSEKK